MDSAERLPASGKLWRSNCYLSHLDGTLRGAVDTVGRPPSRLLAFLVPCSSGIAPADVVDLPVGCRFDVNQQRRISSGQKTT